MMSMNHVDTAFLFFVHERTKRAFMLLHINALTLFYYKIVLAVVPYKLEFVTPSNWNFSLLYFRSNKQHYCHKKIYTIQ